MPVGAHTGEEAGQVAPDGRVVNVLEAVAQPHRLGRPVGPHRAERAVLYQADAREEPEGAGGKPQPRQPACDATPLLPLLLPLLLLLLLLLMPQVLLQVPLLLLQVPLLLLPQLLPLPLLP